MKKERTFLDSESKAQTKPSSRREESARVKKTRSGRRAVEIGKHLQSKKTWPADKEEKRAPTGALVPVKGKRAISEKETHIKDMKPSGKNSQLKTNPPLQPLRSQIAEKGREETPNTTSRHSISNTKTKDTETNLGCGRSEDTAMADRQ